MKLTLKIVLLASLATLSLSLASTVSPAEDAADYLGQGKHHPLV